MSFILRVGAVKPLGTAESHYGNSDEASTSYTDADVLDIPLPEHTYQRPLPPVYQQPLNNVNCFGLPYQDHNYGMPPPPSPPRVPSPRPPSPLQVNGVVQMEEEVKTSPLVSVVEEVVEDSITRCICGYLHDDGYMICCDKCSVWQHIDCMGVDRNNIPDNYFCEICQPRTLDAVQAKVLQKRKREELAARNVLSDSSATDTDPEEAANALASVGKKLPIAKKKTMKQRRNTKIKEKTALKMKVNKAGLPSKLKNTGKKEKENIKTNKPKKAFKPGAQKKKGVKSQPLLTIDQTCVDPWNSTMSPWIDLFEHADESYLSPEVKSLLENQGRLGHSVNIASSLPDKLQDQLVSVGDVKKNRKGLEAIEEIPAGQAIIEYKGQVMLRQEYEQTLVSINSLKSSLHPFVLFYSKLDVNLCVDAGRYGNEARFVRRSCTPNAEVQCIVTGTKIHFVLVAKKPIAKGSEIMIAFDYDYHNSSVVVECACIRSSCAVSRFWKKKTSQKYMGKEIPVKKRKQSSKENRKAIVESAKTSSPLGSPKKVTSPIKPLPISPAAISPPPITSPIKLSNVSTLLAASALLDGQLDVSSDLGITFGEVTQAPFPPVVTPPPLTVSSRRGSRVSDDIKEEKPVINAIVVKEKVGKIKEKTKEKEAKDSHAPAHVEIKRERRLSSRRQSQEDVEEEEKKPVVVTPSENDKNEKEDSVSSAESRKKMTREERKLDAILKAFEKLEKREERKKEATAKSDVPCKKAVNEPKGKKKEDQEEPETKAAIEDDPSPEVKEVKTEADEPEENKPSELSEAGLSDPPALPPSIVVPDIQESKPVKEESPLKVVRRSGKRKRRRSRVQSMSVTSETTLLSQDESSTNSTTGPVSLTPTSATSASVPSTPVPVPMETSTCEGEGPEEIKYTKSKKHLFNEWSTKHETENSKQEEEMFVQCIPSSRGNAMDHLQRRNSHSVGCNRGYETSGGFAKKRWLRQAMHEVPAPTNFNHSLSVSTDNGSVSPVYGSYSPSPGSGLGSPTTPVSPLDFVTPLKKRRLMRESLSGESNGGVSTHGSGLMSENAFPVGTRINGFKQSFPLHRHSVDDRLLLDKGSVQQDDMEPAPSKSADLVAKTSTVTRASVQLNFDSSPTKLDRGLITKSTAAAATGSVHLKFDSLTTKPEETQHSLNASECNLIDSIPLPATSAHLVNGIVSSNGINSSSTLSRTSLPMNLQTAFDKGITKSETSLSSPETHSTILNAKKNAAALLSPSTSKYTAEEDKSHSLPNHVLVNSVYSDVNNLIESSSEAGCVVTKSFMEADGPAPVCVDLNAHEMEPSSLGTKTAIVDLNRELFPLDLEGNGRFSDIQNDCQVNSSEDISNARRKCPSSSSSSCDNPRMDISPSVLDENPEDRQSMSLQDARADRDQEDVEMVDSSQQVVDIEKNIESEANDIQPGPSSSPTAALTSRNELNSISSSGQEVGNADKENMSSLGRGTECDSMEATPGRPDYCDSESSREVVNIDNDGLSEHNVSIDNDLGEEVENPPADNGVSSAPQFLEGIHEPPDHGEPLNDEEDATVSESIHSDKQLAVLVGSDSNVDSTSSEQVKDASLSSWPASHGVLSQCDSNYERLPNVNSIGASASVDDSSAEEVGVSSSSAMRSNSSCDAVWENDRNNEVVREALPDNAVSTGSSEFLDNASPIADVSSGTSAWIDNSPHQESSHEALPCSSHSSSSPRSISSAVISSNILSTPSSHSLPPVQPSTPLCSQEEVSESNITSNSVTTSSITDQSSASLSPVLSSSAAATSSSEAVPATKKKVSLLEYRKRLKEKPPASPVEVKSPTTSSQPTTSVTLSSVSARFLSCGSSSSTVASSSNSHIKKQKMPTLATLPLFKSTQSTQKEERHSKEKRKMEKQLSLTERLRLEFGLDDCGEDASKKPDWHRRTSRAESTRPPPPPPPLPFSIGPSTHGPSTGCTVQRENGSVDSSSGNLDDGVPPPPPPGRAYPYPPPSNPPTNSSKPSSSFSVSSSSTPHQGYHAGTTVNGGPSQVYPQQSSISSTSISPSHARESNGTGYHKHGSHPAHPTAPPFHHRLQTTAPPRPSSSSSIQNAPAASWSSISTPPLFPPVSNNAQPSSTSSIHPPAPRPFDYSNMSSPHAQSTVSGNSVPEDHPPPPPPLPPPPPPSRPHHHHSSSASSSSSSSLSSSSSSSHRHYSHHQQHHHNDHHHYHHHHSSSSKKNKKAASSTSSSSSSSSHYPDKKSRH